MSFQTKANNFQQDLIKFASALFIGMSLYRFFDEGNLSVDTLISNAVGGVIGGLIYAYWNNRKTKHEIFRKK